MNDHVGAADEARRLVRRYPDQIGMMRAQCRARPIGDVRIGFEQVGVARRHPLPGQEFAEAEQPLVDPDRPGEIERLGVDAVAPALDENRVHRGNRQKAVGDLLPLGSEAAAEGGLALEYAVDEDSPAHHPTLVQRDREHIQVTLLDEVEACRIVEEEGPVRPGLEAPDGGAFDEGYVRHRISRWRPACGRGRLARSACRGRRAGRCGRRRERRSRPRRGWC